MTLYTVHVKPNSRKGPFVETSADDMLTVYVREVAAEGKANQAVIQALSRHFNVAKSLITIVRGSAARTKLVRIEDD